jgi:hypothetical protein
MDSDILLDLVVRINLALDECNQNSHHAGRIGIATVTPAPTPNTTLILRSRDSGSETHFVSSLILRRGRCARERLTFSLVYGSSSHTERYFLNQDRGRSLRLPDALSSRRSREFTGFDRCAASDIGVAIRRFACRAK